MAEDLHNSVNVYAWLQISVCSQAGEAEPLKKIPVEQKKKNQNQNPKKPKATKKPLP